MMKNMIELDMEEYKNRYTKTEKIKRLYRLAEKLNVQIGGEEDGHTDGDSEGRVVASSFVRM